MAKHDPKRRRKNKRADKQRRRRDRLGARRAGVQALEARCVLSIAPPVLLDAQSTLVITGGDLADTVVISESDDGASIVVQQYELNDRLTTSYERSSVTALQFFGGAGNDWLNNQTDISVYAEGGAGKDRLEGGRGADILIGGEGDDRLEGGDGDDTLEGGAGVDVLLGEGGVDTLRGGDGADTLYGGDGGDQLHGDAGDDQLFGERGADSLYGGGDKDRLFGGQANDFLAGDAGDDRLEGGNGDDTLQGDAGVDVLLGQEGADTLRGGQDNDTLNGGDGSDQIFGDAGADLLKGEAGEDYLNGGAGDDRLFGGIADDFLNGDAGNDRLEGDDGADTLLGGDGADTLLGEADGDYLDGGADDDFLYGGGAGDLLYGRGGVDHLAGDDGDDYLNGGDDADNLFGGNHDDFLNGGGGNDRLLGGDGDDVLLGGAGADVAFGEAGADRIDGGSENDTLHGGDGDDHLYGQSGVDRLEGNDGNDYLNGAAGDDLLLGGAGNDYLTGVDGVDRLEGQTGADTLLGGAGDDVLRGDEGNDSLWGGGGDDFLYGGDGDDTANGESGNDWVGGEVGADHLHGGDGDDRVVGGVGDDLLYGDAGVDRLEGQDGNDILLGGDDEDSLVSEAGADLLIGGGGGDTVVGGGDEDILIGGSTAYDSDPAALREALAAWNTHHPYEHRVAQLSATAEGPGFIPHETVFADLVSDTLVGGGGQDWFVLSAVNGIFNPLGTPHDAGDAGGHHGDSAHSTHGGHAGGHHGDAVFLDHPPALEGFALIDSLDQVSDAGSSETVTSRMSHSHDSSKLGEHLHLFQLVRYADVTHTAVASGDWSDASTWEDGVVPAAGSRVLIPYGATVTVDAILQPDIFSVRVDGTLSFATDSDSELRVDTVVVTETGSLRMGTAEAPVQAGVTARMLITDNGPIDRVADPFAMGRGVVTHGEVLMHGAEVTPFVTAAEPLAAGATTVPLGSVPIGWSVGDEIVIAGTSVGAGQDETRVIRAIAGGTLVVDPLDFAHAPLAPGLEVHIANLTRNVVIESEASIDSRRGHTMFMHNRDIHISNSAFNGLGRTDKSTVLTDPRVDENWRLIGDSGDNPRARYAIHFHRNGVTADTPPATVSGSVVNGSPGWGFVNHSSYIDFTSNVAFGVEGAAFVAEAGDEIGAFDRNLALNTTGVDDDVDSRVGAQDFGFNGDGFWFQGPGVTVTNNVAAGSTGSAFIYYTRGLTNGGSEIEFLAENLDDPTIAAGAEMIPVIATPIKQFEDNVGYASGVGLTVRYNLRDAPHDAQSIVSDSTFWNNETGVDLPYAHNTLVRDLTILVDPAAGALHGVDNNAQTSDITYQNLDVEGYERSLVVARQGTSVVDGGRFVGTVANIFVLPADASGRQVLITGEPVFGSAGSLAVKDVTMHFQTANAARNPTQVFYDTEVLLQYDAFPNHRLYFRQQAADAVPFPAPLDGLPPAYVGLTQAELASQFGVAIAGEVAPDNAQTSASFTGLVAPDEDAPTRGGFITPPR